MQLTVIIQKSSWSDQLDRCIDAVKPQASRWESFHLIERNSSYLSSFSESMEKRFGNLDLLRFEIFQVLCWGYRRLEGFCIFKYGICHKSATSLSKLFLVRRTPTYLFLPYATLKICWETWGNCEMLDHLGLLSSISNLDVLQLCFLMRLDWKSDPDSIPSHIHFPRVGSFRFEINIVQLFWSLMDFLDTPVLHKLSLDLHDHRGRLPNRWLDQYSAMYASVKYLEFAFKFHQGWTNHLELSKLFQKFPGLEPLNMNSMSNIDLNLRNVDRMLPLRSIVLPSTSPYYFLNGLADALKKYGRWLVRKRLSIYGEFGR